MYAGFCFISQKILADKNKNWWIKMVVSHLNKNGFLGSKARKTLLDFELSFRCYSPLHSHPVCCPLQTQAIGFILHFATEKNGFSKA